MVVHPHAPQIQSPIAAGHIGSEIEPATVGRDSRMGVAGERVGRDGECLGLAPSGVGTGRSPDFGHTRILRVGAANGQVHGLAVGRDRAGALVLLGIKVSLDSLGHLPLPLLILARHEDVAIFHPRYTTQLIARHRGTRRSKVQAITLLAAKSRCIVATAATEEGFQFYRVGRASFLDGLCFAAGLQTTQGLRVAGEAVEIRPIALLRTAVIPLQAQQLSYIIMCKGVSHPIAGGIAKSTECPRRIAITAIGICHLVGHLSPLRALLGRHTGIGSLVLRSGFAVLADAHRGISPAHTALYAATTLQQKGKDKNQYGEKG